MSSSLPRRAREVRFLSAAQTGANGAVIAIDNNLTRLRLARHNALQLGVADRVEFILGDFTDFARAFASRSPNGEDERIDVVFLSPPWGAHKVSLR